MQKPFLKGIIELVPTFTRMALESKEDFKVTLLTATGTISGYLDTEFVEAFNVDALPLIHDDIIALSDVTVTPHVGKAMHRKSIILSLDAISGVVISHEDDENHKNNGGIENGK